MTYADYLETDEWKLTRMEAMERAGGKCQICGANCERLNVHHNTYERLGYEAPTDLVVLCENCHEIFHRNAQLRSAKDGIGQQGRDSIAA